MRIIFKALLLFAFAVPSYLFAQVGLSLGTEYGLGGYVRAGTYPVKVEAGGGVAPTLVFINVMYGEDIFKIYFPATVGAKISFAVTDKDNPDRLGIKAGVSYNGLLRVGFGGGADYEVSHSPTVIISMSLMYFPDAKAGIAEAINKDDGTHYTESSLTMVPLFPVINLSIVF
jgi:hypothetical protein